MLSAKHSQYNDDITATTTVNSNEKPKPKNSRRLP